MIEVVRLVICRRAGNDRGIFGKEKKTFFLSFLPETTCLEIWQAPGFSSGTTKQFPLHRYPIP
jgi:hypothetical protein